MTNLLSRAAAAVATASCLSAAPARATEDGCAAFGSLAASIMDKRQEGIPMSALMEVIETTEGNTPQFIALARKLVIDAYRQPQFMTPDNQQDAVNHFRNETELACYQVAN